MILAHVRIVVLTAAGLCAMSATAAEPAPAAGDDTAQAKQAFERGMAHFQLDEYPEAIEQWEAAFRLRRDPAFLYNIAQAYRLSKNTEKALSFYNKYLKMSPRAPNRAEVEHHIATLEREQNAAPQPGTAPTSPPPAGTGPAAPVVLPPPPPPATPPAVAVSTAPPAETPSKPFYTRPLFWGIAGGVAVAGATVLLLVLLSGSDKINRLPDVSFR